GLLGLRLTDLVVPPHGPEHRAGGRADRRPLARVASDGAPDGTDRGASSGAPSRTRSRRRRRRGGGRRGRVEAGLLHRPYVTVRPVLLLLLLALPLLRIVVGLRRGGRGDEAGGEDDRDGKTAGSMS